MCMEKFLSKAEWMRSLIICFLALGLVAAFLKSFGAFPWATANDYTKLNAKYDKVVVLKDKDNKWQKDLEVKVGVMGNDIAHIKAAIVKIETHMLKKH